MAAKQPWYSITSRNGYRYVRFRSSPPVFIRNRMRAAGMFYSRTEQAWIADDRFTDETISRLISTPLSEAPSREVS